MVCKEFEKLCGNFGSLPPHERIDIMCGLLRMCLPTELRFVGSVVEDLAKKDYHSFREHEIKANSHQKLTRFKHVDDRTLRQGMALTLALLHSWNANCANTIFDILHSNLKSAFDVTPSTDLETRYVILLVLMMAKNHPAFTFYQRTVIGEHSETIERKIQNQLLTAELSCLTGPTTTTTTTPASTLVSVVTPVVSASYSPVQMHSPVGVVSQAATPNPAVGPGCTGETVSLSALPCLAHSPPGVPMGLHSPQGLSSVVKTSQPVHSPQTVSHSPPSISKGCSCPGTVVTNSTTPPPHKHKVHVCKIEVKPDKFSPRHDRKHEYKLLVTWSDGAKSQVSKTYQELREFQSRLVNMFPTEANAPKQERKLPFLGNISPSNREDGADQNFHSIVNYTRQLTKQSQQILECDLVTQFFRKGSPQHVPSSPKNDSQQSNTTCYTVQSAHSPVHNTVSEAPETVMNYQPTQPYIVHNSHLQQNIETDMNCIAKGQLFNSGAMTVHMRPPVPMSPFSSPQSSTRSSPSNSRSTSPADTNQDFTLIMLLINKLGLQRHKACLEKYNIEQLSALGSDDLIKMGMSRVEASKLKSELEEIPREKTSNLPNGLIETNIAPTHHIQGAPLVMHPSLAPHMLMQPPHAPIPYMYFPMPFQHVLPPVSNRDSSPTGSDYSSPSPSPRPQKKQQMPPAKTTDSSSDENDKEKNSKDMVEGGKRRHLHVQNYSPEDSKPLHLAAVPPNVIPSPSDVPLSIQNVGSGYQSDPTPSTMVPRIPGIMARPQYKAQPAHTNHVIPPKHVISMPPDSIMGKRNGPYATGIPIGLAPPIPRSDVQTSSILTASVSSSEMSGVKPMYYFTPGFPVRTPLNGRNFTCNVTNSTAITMATQVFPHPATNGMKIAAGHMTTSMSDNAFSSVQQGAQHENACSRHESNMHSVTSVLQQQNSGVSTSASHSTASGGVSTINSNQQSNAAGTTCSFCGCTGGYVATYPYHHPNAVPHPMASAVPGHLWQWPHPLVPTSNGMVPQLYRHTTGLSYQFHPSSSFPNGLAPEILPLNSQYLHHQGLPAPILNINNSSGPYQYHSLLRHQAEKPRRVTCHNCGSTEHVASDCRENSMESMSGLYVRSTAKVIYRREKLRKKETPDLKNPKPQNYNLSAV